MNRVGRSGRRIRWIGAALSKEGSRYVGFVRKAFADYDFVDMTKHAELAGGKPCVGIAGKFYVVYLEAGGDVTVCGPSGEFALPLVQSEDRDLDRGRGDARE